MKLRIKFLILTVSSKEKIMMLKYQTLKENILLLLIILYLRVTYLIQRKRKRIINKSNIYNLVKKSGLNTKLAALATKTKLETTRQTRESSKVSFKLFSL